MLLLFVRRVTKRICPFGRLCESWLHGFFGRLNDIQRELAVPPTPLYAIRTLYADNTSVNTGVAGGLAAVLEEARKAAHARDDPAIPYHPLKFKGCDDNILALVLTRFNTLFCEWAENAGRLVISNDWKPFRMTNGRWFCSLLQRCMTHFKSMLCLI